MKIRDIIGHGNTMHRREGEKLRMSIAGKFQSLLPQFIRAVCNDLTLSTA